METRANNILVGAFVLVGLALAAIFAIWITRSGEAGGPRKAYYVVFSGSVQGLGVGGAVLFNGLRVGEVTEIRVNPGNMTEIRARIEVDPFTPVKRDTRARLTYQGLTGVASIELSGGTQTAGDLVPGADGVPPALFAERSFVQNILEGGQDTLSRINTVVARIEDIVVRNQENVDNTLRNIRQFSDALAANSQAVSTLLSDAAIAARRVADLSARLEGLANAIEPGRVREIVDNTANIVGALSAQRDAIGTAIADAGRAARALSETIERLQPSVSRMDEIFAAVDPGAVRRTVESVERSSQNVERLTGAIGGEGERIRAVIGEAGEAVQSLRRSAASIENFTAAVGGEGGAGGTFREFTETARAIRATAENLDRRFAEIGAGINRFTDAGLREFQTLVGDSRRAIGGVERALRELERNPQQFIFGRSGVPEYRR